MRPANSQVIYWNFNMRPANSQVVYWNFNMRLANSTKFEYATCEFAGRILKISICDLRLNFRLLTIFFHFYQLNFYSIVTESWKICIRIEKWLVLSNFNLLLTTFQKNVLQVFRLSLKKRKSEVATCDLRLATCDNMRQVACRILKSHIEFCSATCDVASRILKNSVCDCDVASRIFKNFVCDCDVASRMSHIVASCESQVACRNLRMPTYEP